MNKFWKIMIASALAAALCACGGGDGTPTTQANSVDDLPISSSAPLRAPAADTRALAAQTGNVFDDTTFLDWVPTRYGQYYNGTYVSGVSGPYSYRYYPATGNYVALASGDVYILGPVSGGQIQKVGAMSAFECQVFPSNCPVAVSDSMTGLYIGAADLKTAASLMMVARDGRFIGYSISPDGSQMDFFSGTAATQANSFSDNGTFFAHYGRIAPTSSLNVWQGTQARTSGAFVAGRGLVVNLVPTTGQIVSNQLSMSYFDQSNTTASLATVSGAYSTPSAGESITVDGSTGAILGRLNSSCSVNGTASVKEPTRNIYSVKLILAGSGCPGQGTFDGLGYYYTANNGSQSWGILGANPAATAASGGQFVTLSIPRHG